MVRVGFFKKPDALPQGFWSIAFKDLKNPDSDLNTTIQAKPGADGVLNYELFLEIPPGHERVGQWVGTMADRLKDMGLYRFTFDPRTLAQSLGLSIADALTCWGFPFFEHYAIESQVLLQIEQNRRAIYQMVTEWSQRLPHVRFDPELDFDTLVTSDSEQKIPQGKGRKGFLRFLFFGR